MWNGSLRQIDVVEHRIELTPNAKPVHQPPYREGTATRAVIRREIEKLREAGVVEPGNTEWAFPVVFALKKDGSLRLYIDYPRLNAITIRDVYPIPRMDDCLDYLGGVTIFSTLDCNSGYWQVPIAHEDRDKTAVFSHECLFCLTRMPFGLKNAPGTFQCAADILLDGVKWQFTLVYLEDIIIN